MNTKRSITALLLCVCIGVSALLAGCGSSQTNAEGKDAVSIFVVAMDQLHDGELSFSMSGKTNISGTTKYDQAITQNANVKFEIETVDVINPTMPDRQLIKMSGAADINNKETMDGNSGETVDSYTYYEEMGESFMQRDGEWTHQGNTPGVDTSTPGWYYLAKSQDEESLRKHLTDSRVSGKRFEFTISNPNGATIEYKGKVDDNGNIVEFTIVTTLDQSDDLSKTTGKTTETRKFKNVNTGIKIERPDIPDADQYIERPVSEDDLPSSSGN